jgi:hypothetical protein
MAFGSFGELVETQQRDVPQLTIYQPEHTDNVGENFDATVGGTPPPAPVPQQQGFPPALTQWKDTVDKRLGNLERNMQNMATKQEMQAGFQRLEQLISKRPQ